MGCATSTSSAAGDAPPSATGTRPQTSNDANAQQRQQQRYASTASANGDPDDDDVDDTPPVLSLGSLPPLAVSASPAQSAAASPKGGDNRRVSMALSNPTSAGGLRHGSSAALRGRFGSSGRFTGGSAKHWTVTFSRSGVHSAEDDPLAVDADLDFQNGSNVDEARSARSALLSDHMEDSTGLPGPHCNAGSPDEAHGNGDSASLSRVETYSTGFVHVGSQFVSRAPSLSGGEFHHHHDHSPHFHLSYSRRTAGSMATTPHGSRPVSPRGDGPLAAWQLARLRAEALSVGERALQSRSMHDWIDGVLAVFDDKASPMSASAVLSDGEPTTAPTSPRSLNAPLMWSTAAATTTVVSPAGTGCSYPRTPQAEREDGSTEAALHPNAVSQASPESPAAGARGDNTQL